MKYLLLAAACLFSPRALGATRTLTLSEAYRLALAHSEQVALSAENHEELVAKAEEIFSNILPRVSVMGSETLQHVPSGQSNQFIQGHREQGWISAHQPLFAGFREFLAYRASKMQGESGELMLERVKHLLYLDVARSFLDLRGAQNEIELRQALVGVTRDRIKELTSRIAVGRSRRGELLAAESALASALAFVEQARAKERAALSRLCFLTGTEETELVPVEPSLAREVPDLDALLRRARARPDVAAKKAEARAAELAATIVSRRRWPSLALDANYYLHRPPSFTDRVKWDAAITGSLPLYAGGEISAQTRQQAARLRAAKQALALAERTAELEARIAREDLKTSARVVSSLAAAADAAQADAKSQAEDYRLGQVSNLDVFASLNALWQTRLGLDQARLESTWARVRLEVAAGSPGGPL
ncbi:MAG: TolC family protein [Elusimicrobiota bacterium]